MLARWLLQLDMDDDLDQLLNRYPDDAAATWAYTHALASFRRNGPGRTATAALKRALRSNPYVPPYLLGEKQLPGLAPELIGLGDEREALDYVFGALSSWQQTPGALEWLARIVKQM